MSFIVGAAKVCSTARVWNWRPVHVTGAPWKSVISYWGLT